MYTLRYPEDGSVINKDTYEVYRDEVCVASTSSWAALFALMRLLGVPGPQHLIYGKIIVVDGVRWWERWV